VAAYALAIAALGMASIGGERNGNQEAASRVETSGGTGGTVHEQYCGGLFRTCTSGVGTGGGPGDATLDGWSASEPDAVLGVPGMSGHRPTLDSPDDVGRVLGGMSSGPVLPRQEASGPPIAAAGLGLSTPPNVEMWRAEVERYPWPVHEAMAVLRCESGGNPLARGAVGEAGLFQLRPEYHAWRAQGGDLYDGPANIMAAYSLYADQGWRPWSCKP